MKEVSVSFLKEGNYEQYINILNETTCNYIHFDVMDGKFVNGKNLPLNELTKLLNQSQKKNDIHLMVENPAYYINNIPNRNIEYITIHYETKNILENIEKIKKLGIKVGIAINPDTNIEKVYKYLNKIDLVLLMGVIPGKSGQEFIKTTYDKIKELKNEIKKTNRNIKISIDGGVCDKVFPYIKDCDIIVSASYVLDNLKNIEKIKKIS